MDLPPLIVDFKLNALSKTYYVSGDAPTNYIWTVFFKIDGDTVSVGPLGNVQGTATVIGTPGDHGDIFDDGNEGVWPIPASLGAHQFRLWSIPIDPFATSVSGTPSVPATVGCVVLVLEQNDTPDNAVAAGHAALNSSLQQQLNALIPTFNSIHKKVTPADIETIKQKVQDAVTQAIKDALSNWDKILTGLGIISQDTLLDHYEVGGSAFIFGQDDLLTAPAGALPMRALLTVRGQRTRGGPRNDVLLEWALDGQVTAQTPFWVTGAGTIAPGKSQDWWFSFGDGDAGPELIQAEPVAASGELATTQIAESRDGNGVLTYHAAVHNQGANAVAFQWRGGGV